MATVSRSRANALNASAKLAVVDIIISCSLGDIRDFARLKGKEGIYYSIIVIRMVGLHY